MLWYEIETDVIFLTKNSWNLIKNFNCVLHTRLFNIWLMLTPYIYLLLNHLTGCWRKSLYYGVDLNGEVTLADVPVYIGCKCKKV